MPSSRIFEKQKDMRYEVKLVIDQGPYVMVHNWLQRWPGDRGAAVVDILRVEKGWIVEHWDVLQWIPEESPQRPSDVLEGRIRWMLI